MTLGTRTTIILLFAISAYALIDLAIQQYVVLPSYEEIETTEAERNLTRCIDALRREGHHLNRFCADWSAWDDTLEFVEGKRPQYVEENLGLRTLISGEINYFAFIDLTGKLVWGAAYELTSKEPIGVPELPVGDWPALHPLLQHASFDSTISGILDTAHGPMLICAQPITQFYNQDRIGGTLIMGRLLGPELLNTLRDQTQVDMTLHRLAVDSGDPAIAAARKHAPHAQSRWLDKSQPGEILANAAVPDIYGNTAFILRVRLPRTITERGREALFTDAFSGLAAGAGTLFFLLAMLRRFVARPLKSLTEQVSSMAEQGTLTSVEETSRTDEIGMLARAFNTMEQRVRTTYSGQIRAEGALRQSESRLRTILNATPDVIFVIDRDGTIQTTNMAVSAVLGYEVEHVIGRNVIDFAPVRLRVRAERLLRAYRDRWSRNGGSRAGEFVALRRDGTETAIHVALSKAETDTGPIIALTLRDITELNALHDRIARSQRLAEIGQMGASVAHEIRNPIAGISGAAQILLKSVRADDPHRTVLEEMLAQSRRVENTVRQLLGYSRPLHPSPTKVDIGKLVEDIARRCESDGTLTPHSLQVNVEGATVSVVDENLLSQLLLNLVGNAAQAMDRPGRITLSAIRPPGLLKLIVEDEGPGFNDIEKSSRFEPFKTTKVQGTGLGLAICQGIAIAHGGSIRLANRDNGGARVVVFIPQGPEA